jgi:hypothetical protein
MYGIAAATIHAPTELSSCLKLEPTKHYIYKPLKKTPAFFQGLVLMKNYTVSDNVLLRETENTHDLSVFSRKI